MSFRAGRSPAAVRLALLVTSFAMGIGRAPAVPVGPAAEPTAAERVEHYSGRIAKNPGLYPLHTQLALACLDRARETHDPSWLARARAAAATAQAIQDNYDSLLALAAIENYAHRFDEALRWARRAAEASVNGPAWPDPVVSAALVEAHLGLGQVQEAGRLVPASPGEIRDYEAAAARGRWLAAADRPDDATSAWGVAAALAAQAGESERSAFAEAMAGGVLLDAGRPAAAKPHIESAARIDATLPAVVLHQAELELAEGNPAGALARLESHLAGNPDPAIEALAYEAALRAGDPARAERHYAAAEKGLERAIAAGEVYTLGALARLYATAGRSLDRALFLAQENLRWKRDREALDTLAAVRKRRAAGTSMESRSVDLDTP